MSATEATSRRTRRAPRRADPVDAELRIGLDRLLRAIDAELEKRKVEADLEPARTAPVDIEGLSDIAADLPRLAGHAARALGRVGRAGRADARRLVRGGFDFLNRQAELANRRRLGEQTVDEFGFDAEWTETFLPLFRWVFRNWWRVRTIGLENVPADGRALLVANHAGVVPYDGAMVRVAVLDEHPAHRHCRALVLDSLMELPVTGWLMRRTGNTLATSSDAELLLQRDNLVLVFPEGSKGPGKLYHDRYRLERFGRGGFVEIALRTGAPIVPVSIVGSEEIHPMLADIKPLARALGLPYAPITPTLPLAGPLGVVPLPSSWVMEFHEPIRMDGFGPRAADDAGLVLELTEQVRDVIQAGVYRNLELRGSVFA